MSLSWLILAGFGSEMSQSQGNQLLFVDDVLALYYYYDVRLLAISIVGCYKK